MYRSNENNKSLVNSTVENIHCFDKRSSIRAGTIITNLEKFKTC